MVTQKKIDDAICEIIGKFREKMTFHKDQMEFPQMESTAS